MKSNDSTIFNYNALSRLPVPVGWGEAHHSWRERMTSIYPIICKLKIPYSIVYEMQSMIHCAGIPHGFAKGGLHPTLQKRGLSIECLIHDRWKYKTLYLLQQAFKSASEYDYQ